MDIDMDIIKLFICFCAPMALLIYMLPCKVSLVVESLILGSVIAVFTKFASSYVADFFATSPSQYSMYIAPLLEEILKSIPVIIFAATSIREREFLVLLGVSVGFGFAIFENIYYYLNFSYSTNLIWALSRGFSTALLHGLCGYFLSYSIFYIYKNKRLFLSVMLGMLSFVSMFHSIFNIMIYSKYYNIMLLIPPIIYVFILIFRFKYSKRTRVLCKW